MVSLEDCSKSSINCVNHNNDNEHSKLNQLWIRIRHLKFGLNIVITVILLLEVNHKFVFASVTSRIDELQNEIHAFASSQHIFDERISSLRKELDSKMKQLEVVQNELFEKNIKLGEYGSMRINEKKYEHGNAVRFKKNKNKVIKNNQTMQHSNHNIEQVIYIPRPPKKLSFYQEIQSSNSKKKETLIKTRNLRILENFTDYNRFELSLQVDITPHETSWELVDMATQNLIRSESYRTTKAFSLQPELIYIKDGSYQFKIFDSNRNGICRGLKNCSPYNISINDDMIIEGSDFGSEQSHTFSIIDTTICVGNLLVLYRETNFSFELIDLQSNEVLVHKSHQISNSSSPQRDAFCVDDGTYMFSTFKNETNGYNDRFMNISVNGKLFFEKKYQSLRYTFVIIDGEAQKFLCYNNPYLEPFNSITGNTDYDERIAELLNMLYTVSSYDDIHNIETPQYKAACYILYDDDAQMTIYNKVVVERYSLYLFLLSTKWLKHQRAIPNNFCDLDVVECKDDHIIELNFGSNDLEGNIPTELGNFRFLERLELNWNSLDGTIPSQVGRLTHLELLDLQINDLSGTIPPEIGRMKKLQFFYLNHNNVEGTIPSELFDLTNLKSFYLYGGNNKLIGTISTKIGQLSRLQNLWLSGNQLSGTIPTEVGLLLSLRSLSLSFNQLKGTIPTEFTQCKLINELRISDNDLRGTLPDLFQNTTELRLLYLSNNRLSGEIPSSLWYIDSLFWLELQNNNLEGIVPEYYCDTIDYRRGRFDVDSSSWFIDQPNVNCSCCEREIRSCSMWDPIFNPRGHYDAVNTVCPEDNAMKMNSGVILRYVLDIHTNETINILEINDHANDWIAPFHGICSSPTGCYKVNGRDINDGYIEKEWYLGYSKADKALIPSDTANLICDAVDICGKLIDSNHPRRIILNYFMQTLISNSSILYDTASYEHKALCWMMGDDDDNGTIDNLEACDGTLLQFCVIGLFFSSTNYLNSMNPFSSLDRLCDFDEIECDGSNKFIEELNLNNKNLIGTLITEIGFLRSLKKINLSGNELRGTIDESILLNLPNLEVFDVNTNSFESEIPKNLLSHPSLKVLNISSNLFVGTLPSSLSYSSTFESFEVADNLLQGGIPNELFDCLQLRTFDISQNKFNGTVPTLLGQLHKIINIRLNENEIKGSLPSELFDLTHINVLMLQSNKLTGSIPTMVGKLEKMTKLILNHNSLKGNIPSELHNLKHLETIHLHHNQLTGIAPNFTETNMISFITDCGFPNYALPNPLKCHSCTMCCNSEGACQETKSKSNIWTLSIQVVGLMIIGCMLFFSLISIIKSAFGNRQVDLKDIYTATSVHSFIFAKCKASKIIYALSIFLQLALFIVYMQASDINKEATDWKFTYQCPDNRIDCIDLKKSNDLGWFMFTTVILCFMGPYIIMSIKQIDQGIIRKNFLLVLSGLILFFLTTFAIYCSFVYNRALAIRNTDLILNAIVLIFIMELDDQIFVILKKLFPKWTTNVEKTIQNQMK